MSDYLSHPLSTAYPGLSEEELKELAEDIKANGLLEPIVLYQGQVLDGRHRLRACQMAGVEPRFVPFESGDPVKWVASKNDHRRHLSAGQRAQARVRLSQWAKAQAKGASVAPEGKGASVAPSDRGASVAPPPPEYREATVKETAEELGVSERTVKRARAAERAGLGDAVIDGTMSVETAARGGAKTPPKDKPQRLTVEQSEKLISENKALQAAVERLTEEKRDLEDEVRALDGAKDQEAYEEIKRNQTDVIRSLERKNAELQTQNAALTRRVKALLKETGRKA